MGKDTLIIKPIGEILREAGLIHSGQVQVALMEQAVHDNLKLGEILALHGWISPLTADFFGDKFKTLVKENQRKQIGNYFLQAGLLTENEINVILNEQKKGGVKFGSLAVLKGFIKEETLTFFLKYFHPETMADRELATVIQDNTILHLMPPKQVNVITTAEIETLLQELESDFNC
jgi:hypothetical protein